MVMGEHGGPKLAPRKRMGASSAALLAIKGFPEKQQSLWEISGERGWQRETAQCSPGGFSQEDSPELRVRIQGEQRLMQPSPSSAQYSEHTAPGKASIPGRHQTPTQAGKRRVHNTASPLGLHECHPSQ